MPPVLPASAADPASWAAGQTVRPAESSHVSISDVQKQMASCRQATSKAKEAGQQFEAMYLRQMLEESMPKDSETLFGKGTSGTMWRSMLADSMATTLSKSGTIGLAQMVIKSETSTPEGK
jgi:Rod binding domain-containing protein